MPLQLVRSPSDWLTLANSFAVGCVFSTPDLLGPSPGCAMVVHEKRMAAAPALRLRSPFRAKEPNNLSGKLLRAWEQLSECDRTVAGIIAVNTVGT
jgi:hypothetical protein